MILTTVDELAISAAVEADPDAQPMTSKQDAGVSKLALSDVARVLDELGWCHGAPV